LTAPGGGSAAALFHMSVSLASLLLDWYEKNARKLPWRDRPDPYEVLVSEVMLQQTRVETVIPYFQRWMERFPDIPALAAASQQDVLQVWEGLGYYSRARGLHQAARQIMEEHAGKIPSDLSLIRRLPSVGRYTAAAVASIAFQKDEAALDGNIRRVLARVFNVTEPARSPQGERRLWELAADHLPPGRAGNYNQALMDLGAQICTPRRPDCPRCPLQSICQARLLGVQEQRPVSLPRRQTPHYQVTAAVIRRGPLVLIARRPQQGLLGGLWEFPGGKQQEGEDLPACLQREIMEELGVPVDVGEQVGVYQHAYTHYKVTLHAFYSSIISGEPQPIQAADVRWVALEDLFEYPMGKIDRQISRDLHSL
jgi:A/G-specific adenine glycosylase